MNSKKFSKLLNNCFDYTEIIPSKKFYSRFFWIISSEIILFGILLLYHYLRLFFARFEVVHEVAASIRPFLGFFIANSINSIILWMCNLLIFLKEVFVVLNNDLMKIQPCSIIFLKWKSKTSYGDRKLERWGFSEAENEINAVTWILAYNHVVETCLNLNKCFNLSAMGTTILVMVELITSLFEMIALPKNMWIVGPWIAFVVLQLFFLIFSCELVSEEVSISHFEKPSRNSSFRDKTGQL